MALPQSFQEALGRAETERRLERDTVLQRIGETVQKGVPYLSGVIAGALSKSPIMALGATFVADRLQARFEEKREQRRTRRFEDRQRREAAKIAVREGLYQNEKEALADIEANRLAEEQENTRQQQQQLLQKFGLNRKEEEVQEEREDVVREQTEGPEGLALQSTLSHIDSEISGIADLLLDRFADEESRYDKEQVRKEIEAAKLRETLSEEARRQEEVQIGEPERERENSLLAFFGRIPLPLLFAGAIVALTGAIAGLGLLFKDRINQSIREANEKADEIADSISEGLNDIQKALTKDGEDMSKLIAEFKIFQETMRKLGEFIKNRFTPTPRTPVQRPPTRIPQQVRNLMLPPGDGVRLPENQRGAPQRDFRFFNVTPEDRIGGAQQPRATYNQVANDIMRMIGQFIKGVGAPALAVGAVMEDLRNPDPNTYGPADLLEDIGEGLRSLRFYDVDDDMGIPLALTPNDQNLGRVMGQVSQEQLPMTAGMSFNPIDASTLIQNTSVSRNDTYTAVPISPTNMDMRRKFVS